MLRRQFYIDGKMLECVKVFKYLGRMVNIHDEDRPAVRAQLRKARACWNWIARILDGENASPRVCRKFFKSIVQSVLLYCSETWNLTPCLLRRLEGFQLRCAYQMAKANNPKRRPGRA